MFPSTASTKIETTLLAEFRRNGLVENRHWGWFAICNTEGTVLYSTPGSHKTAIFLRSSAKPFQAMPLVQSGLHQELTAEELAITCASHIASPYHVQMVRNLLQKAGLSEKDLLCGPHMPIHQESAQLLLQKGIEPNRLHNNCSGKHAGMLYYCVHNHLPIDDYLNPEHPLQERITKTLQDYSELERQPQSGIDGCGTPTHQLTINKAAQLYANLGSSSKSKPIVEAICNNPIAFGGLGRVDTAIIKASKGKLLAKVGADGVIGVSRVGKREGLILKIADGKTSVRNHVIVALLKKLDWLNLLNREDPCLKPFQDVDCRNTQNRVIGELKILLPK